MPPKVKTPCVHCGALTSYKRRDLCYRCFRSPIRDKYPVLQRMPEVRRRPGESHVLNGFKVGDATDAPPGSESKIMVLQARVERRLPLWHPRDLVITRDELDLPGPACDVVDSDSDYEDE